MKWFVIGSSPACLSHSRLVPVHPFVSTLYALCFLRSCAIAAAAAAKVLAGVCDVLPHSYVLGKQRMFFKMGAAAFLEV